MERKTDKRQILQGILLLLALGIVCVLVYKAQVREDLDQPIEYTMMTEHKETGEVILSADTPELRETFLCLVPELRSLSIECSVRKAAEEAVLWMELADAETGEVFYQREMEVSRVISERSSRKLLMELGEPLADSEGKTLVLTWRLENAGSTRITLTANQKQAIVSAFNGEDGNRTNVIYTLSYGWAGWLKPLYVLLCAALLLTAALLWLFIVIRKMSVEKLFLPAALLLGMLFQCVITVYGVPDEPGHFDTAYKYSNYMLFVEAPGDSYTVAKRKCDAEMCDMLANGLESNSYYQLLAHTFEQPEDTGLVEVGYMDATNLVPGIVYVPAAAGISLGRLLNLSAMLTMQLGRLFNLLAFALLAWAAIRLVPFGKNLFGMLALLPITLQQGASYSYDAMINGALFLFLALCFRIKTEKQSKKWEWILLAVLALFTAVLKGGVYLPLLLLLLLLRPLRHRATDGQRSRRRAARLGIFAGVTAILLIVAFIKFMPVFQTFLMEREGQTGDEALYTIPYLLRQPAKIVYMYWNTLMEAGDTLLKGLLGGMLSWLDLRMNGLFALVFLGGLLLLLHVEGDRHEWKTKEKWLIAAACGVSAALIMMSMLVGYTTRKWDYIQGLQGRYFLPLAPALFVLTSNHMVHVGKRQCTGIWMTMMTAEVLLLLQAAAMAI